MVNRNSDKTRGSDMTDVSAGLRPQLRAVTASRLLMALVVVASCVINSAGAQQSFDEQRTAVSASPATQPEDVIISLLKTGIAESKPTQAIAVTQRWLRENVAQNPLLLFHAGQAAERAADWPAAVALYRQYLKRADLQSETASEAILASYTLQINHLDAPDNAYAYSRSEGHRLVANAQARQFDRWFLDLAKKRNDLDSVAARLLALTQAKVSNDLLVALYSSDLHWLLTAINNGRIDQARYAPRFIESVKTLAKAIAFDKELALLLDWSVSVKVYNMAILDGEQAAPPIAEATALLKAYPRHAERVQTGWAGGNRGPHYRGDARKYWPLDQAAKLAPVNTAAAKLSPLDQARFYQSFGSSYYSGKPQLVPADKAAQWVLDNSKLANSKAGPVLQFNWHGIKLEDAKKLAPLLAQNPSPEAAGIRAIAAVNDESKELDKTVDTLIKNEAWRLNPHELPGYIDRLWHRAGRPGGNARRNQLIARGKQAAGAISKTAVKKEQPVNQRLTVFRSLWNDYKSNQPKQIGVRPRLVRALSLTPEALPELIRDQSIEARMLLHEVMNSGRLESADPAWAAFDSARRIYTDRYAPCFNEQGRRHYGGMNRFVKNKEKYRPHPLGPTFHKLLEDQLKQSKVQSWVVFAWLNTQFPEDNAKSVALIKELAQSPAWETLPFDVRNGARRWFKTAAMTPAQATTLASADANLICKSLIELPKDTDAAAVAAALKTTLEGLKQSPIRHEIVGLDRIFAKGKKKANPLEDPDILAQVLEMAGPMRSFQADPALGTHLLNVLSKNPDPAVLHAIAPFLWRDTELYHRTLQDMIGFADKMVEINPSAAHALAKTGLQTIARHKRGHTYYKRETDIPRLNAIRGKAALKMRLIDIPVPPTHQAYAIYKSQAEFTIGNEDSARELLVEHADQLLAVHRDLSVQYLLWVLQHLIDARDEAQQEALVKAMMAWMQESDTAFTVDQRVALEIAYGDIAVQRGMLPEAHKIFARIQSNSAYASVFARHTATLRRVRVERISKDFDAALQTLMGLDAQKVPRLTTAAHYARAEVYYDIEEFQDAADQIAKVLEREPAHPDATLLRGRVQLKLQRLIEATEVELGSATKQASLVPGEVLKVTLNDPTLSVSSGGSEIEVVVWATSGDKEHLLLRQFGDEKTKYRGEVRTALGKPEPGDRTLQVIGEDEIFYAYSEAFRAKVTNLGENRGGPIIVASDAMLMASARKLLSANEQRVADMEAVTAALDRKGITHLQNTDPAVIAALKAEATAAARKRALQTRVKPGNPIHVRVIDPDRGRTADVDELPVTVISSSGDSVGRIVLKETGTHTGLFEGSLPTSRAQAMAFGSSSETGRNPSMVISPNNKYSAWRPVPAKNAQHTFTIDLNDNAPLGSLEIEASDTGFALKSFLVQTAMNHGRWTTVARSPNNPIAIPKVWNPSIVVMNDTDRFHTGGRPTVYALPELEEHLEQGWLAQRFAQAVAQNVAGPSAAMPASIPTALKWKRHQRHDCSHIVYRFRGWFYEHADVTRRFQLTLGKHAMPENTHSSLTSLPKFLMAVNGRPITKMPVTEVDGKQTPNPKAEEMKLAGGKLEGEIYLRAGLHRFEIWGIGWVQTSFGFGRSLKLQANLDGDDKLVDCPDNYFDPTTFPEDVLEQKNAPAKLTANNDNTKFTVAFAEGSRARLLRILFVGNEGPVPSLNRLKLTTPDGGTLLPVPHDFAGLRKNDTLEILSGDRVTVRYVDDRFVTKGQQKHERFLNVSYSDGRIEFADIEPRPGRHNKLEPYYERLLRFQHGKPFPVVIRDADMDVSVEPDEVTFRATDGDGNERQFVAKETGPSTGTFRAFVTPVAKKTSVASEIHIPADGMLEVAYRDTENNRPGVPYDRTAACASAVFRTPTIEVAHMTVTRAVADDAGPAEELHLDFVADLEGRKATAREQATMERIRNRYEIRQTFVDASNAPAGGIKVVHGRVALIDVIAPHIALGTTSTVDVFVQTDAGRKFAGGGSSNGGFDVDVRGTLRFKAMLGSAHRVHSGLLRAGYRVVATDGENLSRARSAEERSNDYLEAGRFRVGVPLIAGVLPRYSYADPQKNRELELPQQYGLTVRTGERIHIGVRYKDDAGKTHWATSSAKVIAHPMLDVMNEGYRDPMTEAFVGEKVHLRVIDLAADRTGDRDTVRCYMASKSSQKHYVYLRETDMHTGIFKGSYQLTYASKDAAADDGEYDVRRHGFPVIYGDAVGVRYTDASGRKTPAQYVTIGKGSDGTIAPFSKQYEDSEMAMHTQFAMAESYLELARRHRKTGEPQQADREFSRAKQLLANAVTQFTDPETRSHAEYLLGDLTQENAEATRDPELRRRRYQAALARFMTITGSYADTEYASKAQFKIAVIYEALKEPEIAAQEYVKLAYKYPESEHLATAMARLGTHFQRKAVTYEREAAPLLAKAEADPDDKDAKYKGTALKKLSHIEYVKAAQIFERLQTRFPNHDLAGKAGLRAGQIYMRAQRLTEAVKALMSVINEEAYDGPTLRSEAMYWAARCHESLGDQLKAYGFYKRITYDFPESKWAAYARAQLSTERLLRLDRNLEIKRLEEGQE